MSRTKCQEVELGKIWKFDIAKNETILFYYSLQETASTQSSRRKRKMKLTCVLVLSFSFAVRAFGVSSDRSLGRKATTKVTTSAPTAFQSNKVVATKSPLFRDPTAVRAGAVPGWAAYNEALDKQPLITKAMTSLVGWALGDLLAQVRKTLVDRIIVVFHV